MQVNAVSTKGASSFGHRMPTREELENFAAADDRTLQAFAVKAASDSVNDKKHKRISNAIWYSLPVAAGLADVVRNSKVVGRIPKLKIFAATTAAWAGTFAVIDAVFAGKRAADKHSSTLRDFNKEHPILSTVATLGAAVGVLLLAGKGANKLLDKYGDKAVQFLKKHKVDKTIKESKLITNTMKAIRKVPSSIKNFAKGVIDWSPMILVLTSITHTFNHERAKAAETAKNYTVLKAEQAQVKNLLNEVAAIENED